MKKIYVVNTIQEDPLSEPPVTATMERIDIDDFDINNPKNMGCSEEHIMRAIALGYDTIEDFAIEIMGYDPANEGSDDIDEMNPDEATICDNLEELFEFGNEDDDFPAMKDFIEISM